MRSRDLPLFDVGRSRNPSESSLFSGQGFFPDAESVRGTTAPRFGNIVGDANAQLWGNMPLSDDRMANALKMILFKKQREAAAKGQAADAARKIQLFDSMTPDEIQRIYSGAPESDDEAEIQKTIADYTNGANRGFAIGYKNDLDNITRGRQQALFDRQIRDSDLNYQLRQDQADRNSYLADLQDRRVDVSEQREGRQAETQAARQRRDILKDAINSVSGGSVHPNDIATLFPDLNPQEVALVRQYGQQAQSLSDEDRRASGLAASSYNDRLKNARLFFNDPANAGASARQKEAAINAVMADFAKDKNVRGMVQYDPTARTFVPISEPATPRVPSRPLFTNRTPEVYGPPNPPTSPLDRAFSMVQQARDPVIDTLNQRASRAPEGKVVRQNGVAYVFRGGRWSRL